MKTLVALSDMHVGSIYSIMPDSYTRQDGNTVQPNRAQKEILGNWKKMCNEWHRPDIALCNGDIIDGWQPANQGVETWTTSLAEQVDAATQLLDMLDAKRWLFTRGTPYHTSMPALEAEDILAQNFGADHAEYDIGFDFEGHRIHASHTISYSHVWHYRTTPLAREMLIAKLNEQKDTQYEWLIRSHVHYFVQIRYGNHAALTLPGWETRTPYTIRKSPHDFPDIGAIRLTHKNNHEFLQMQLLEWSPPKRNIVKI